MSNWVTGSVREAVNWYEATFGLSGPHGVAPGKEEEPAGLIPKAFSAENVPLPGAPPGHAELPPISVPLPGQLMPLPGHATPLPGQATPLPGQLLPVAACSSSATSTT